ncbi:hypothetical protein FA09DRAFT_300444, partial [Tilletiopsis washingtonensis]
KSDISDDEVTERGVALKQETVWERIAALVDIVPSSTRARIAHTFRTASAYAFFGGRLAGNLVWVVTTSALLVGLPYALALEDESRIVAQEKEMYQQQQGAQMLGGGAPQQPGQAPAAPGAAGGIRPPGF